MKPQMHTDPHRYSQISFLWKTSICGNLCNICVICGFFIHQELIAIALNLKPTLRSHPCGSESASNVKLQQDLIISFRIQAASQEET